MSCSAFSGIIDEIPYIRVDNFKTANQHKVRAYFLSHCHTDHTQGLHSIELFRTLENTNAKIYMSEETRMVINDDKNDKLMKYIVPLKLGSQLITIPGDKDKNIDEILLDVTLVAAGHCFGSVMFLFRTKLKTILFTGDFRINSNDLKKYNYLHEPNGEPIKIHVMYVDTTFIDCYYKHFPKRSSSVEMMIEEIRSWLNEDNRNAVALHTPAKYGYEFVFNEIYKNLGHKVSVDNNRWEFYSTQRDVIGVTKEPSKIHVCLNYRHLMSHNLCPGVKGNLKYLYVQLSAMKWKDYDEEDKMVNRRGNHIHVCFPTHCSRTELLYFVNYFSAIKVVGFPNQFINSPEKSVRAKIAPRNRFIVAPTECAKKVCDELLKEMFKLQ